MHIDELRLDGFRNFSQALINPSPSFNVIYGDNGAGKSSLLEAIHVLGYGRSFRTTKTDSLIKTGDKSFTAFCRYTSISGSGLLAANRDKASGFLFNVDGAKTRRVSDVAKILPIQIFTPQSSDLIIGAPLLRRRFIDWLVFHVEQSFYAVSNKYANVLSQRNALLKQCGANGMVQFKEQDVWSGLLSNYGNEITRLRKLYIEALESELKKLYQEFRPDVDIELRYNQGWDSGADLATSLDNKIGRDLFRGSTSSGPHKADIQFMVGHLSAAEYLSRGQLRVLVSLLLVAEVRVLKSLTNKRSIFLVDDIAAELDIETRELFLDTIVSEETQVFVTAIERNQLSFVEKYKNKKVFHVKQNHVQEE